MLGLALIPILVLISTLALIPTPALIPTLVPIPAPVLMPTLVLILLSLQQALALAILHPVSAVDWEWIKKFRSIL